MTQLEQMRSEIAGLHASAPEPLPFAPSLELMHGLDFDVLVPWAATGGQPHYAVTSRANARRRIDAIRARVERGADR